MLYSFTANNAINNTNIKYNKAILKLTIIAINQTKAIK